VDIADLQLLKHITLVFSLFTHYGSLGVHFMREYLEFLCKNFSVASLELIQVAVVNAGRAIRSESPLILKSLIQEILSTFAEFKKGKESYPQAVDFIIQALESIKVNKSIKNDPTEKLEFLKNYLHKSLPKRFGLSKKRFPCGFNQALAANFSNGKWFLPSFHSQLEQ
jgi:hypothetical protein